MYTIQEDELGRAARELKIGKVAACPTDTVYGLLADAADKEAVQRVFQVKGRAKGKPLPVFVKNIAMAKKLAFVSKEQEKYLKNIWPGKVTVVLKSRGKLPKELEMQGKVALRIPNYDTVQILLKKTNRPLTGTSANVSGKSSCSSAKEVLDQFRKRKQQPDIIIEAGKLRRSKPSKIIDITAGKTKIIRT